jgi:hypothetical protein
MPGDLHKVNRNCAADDLDLRSSQLLSTQRKQVQHLLALRAQKLGRAE